MAISNSVVPVSVVIPTYNRADLLIQSIDSALVQTVAPAEIIVVDDGSMDNTRDRLEAYSGRIRYVCQQNRGVSAARNHGISLARGEFVAFLDSDDVWHPRKLECQMGVFDKYPDVGLLGTGEFDWPTPAFPELPNGHELPVSFIPWHRLVVKNYLSTSSVLVRRELLERAGEFDTDLQGPEDRDLWLRIAEFSTVANVDVPLTGYRNVPGSVSQQAARVHESMMRMLRKLDARGAWRGRLHIRLKSYSYVFYTSFQNYNDLGDYRAAAMKMIGSLAWYPLPFRGDEIGTTLARPKGLVSSLLRSIKHQ